MVMRGAIRAPARADIPARGRIAAAALVAVLLVGAAARVAGGRPTVPEPERIRGVYLPTAALADPARRAAALELLAETEVNTVVVDVKDQEGLRYRSALPLADALSADGPLSDPRSLVDSLHAAGAWVVARIVVYNDPKLARLVPGWAIRTEDGAATGWVSPYEGGVTEHVLDVAEEVVEAGFDEVQFDYVRFPTESPQVHPERDRDRSGAIRDFLVAARERLGRRVPVSADVFGWSMHVPGDVGIGQNWERLLTAVDRVHPMVYPSHYPRRPGRPHPNNRPAETVRWSLAHGLARAEALRDEGFRTARVIPWLQGFSAPWIDPAYRYGPKVTRWQKDAVYDVGLDEWILWNPNGDYDFVRGGLDAKDVSRARTFDAPDRLAAGQVLDASRERVLEDYLAER